MSYSRIAKLIDRIAHLNRDAGEIGAGMLASLIDEARAVLVLANARALPRLTAGDVVVVECSQKLSLEQQKRLAENLHNGLPDGVTVLIEQPGFAVRVLGDGERLAAIEGKLDALIAALADEPQGGEREEGTPL